MYHIILKLYIDIINQVEKPPDYLIFFQQMLQFRVILYPFHFIRDNLLNFLLDPVVICLYFFLYPVVPVLVPEIYNLG